MCILSFPPKNDKMPQTNRRKCSRHGHSQITGSAVLVCAGMHELVCEPKGLAGWGEMIGFSGRKRQKQNK